MFDVASRSQPWPFVQGVNRVVHTTVDTNSSSSSRYSSIRVVSPLGPCTVCVWCIFEGWSVDVKYWCTLRARGRRAEGGLCLSLPGRWNKLKSIGNTFCPLASSLITDTKHTYVWETADTVMFYVIVYLIHMCTNLGAQSVLVRLQCAFYFSTTTRALSCFFLPFQKLFQTWVDPISFFFITKVQKTKVPQMFPCSLRTASSCWSISVRHIKVL